MMRKMAIRDMNPLECEQISLDKSFNGECCCLEIQRIECKEVGVILQANFPTYLFRYLKEFELIPQNL